MEENLTFQIKIFFLTSYRFPYSKWDGNNSLYEENGFYFTVTYEFYLLVKKMLNLKNKYY
tara:strand:- start:73 stop:252 length:180 start_codon:yes stop_codon:yes gene_type:complete